MLIAAIAIPKSRRHSTGNTRLWLCKRVSDPDIAGNYLFFCALAGICCKARGVPYGACMLLTMAEEQCDMCRAMAEGVRGCERENWGSCRFVWDAGKRFHYDDLAK